MLSPGLGLCICGCVVTVIDGNGLGVEIAIIVRFCLVVGTCKLVCIW